MTNSEFITALMARRDRIRQEHAAMLEQGRIMEAEDLLPAIKFACKQVQEALVARQEGE